ncbi:ABC transporter ATP-binding protein [Paenibacillus nasutitermitis]|uniref:ABC transporter n=1 Tax=Paenibacillus nasutitermitis TaxID=1652958 RepID=A0A917DX96_9BACL|nr:ABC transporter ATP-binding protein [Paenibacillus nasutitermitis]GGD80342.1 ABC transporter [Paenibacillus nasutitermitis]
MEQSVIRLQEIVQKRKHFELGPVNLNIPQGYVTAIVGPNGSGKSSLFRLMLDLSKPDSGQIEMLGERIGNGRDHLLKQKIGYVPEQSIEMDDHLTADKKADFIRKWYPNWDLNLYRELLRRFDVETSLKLGKMSKGMRRKFDLAVAMAHQPQLLMLDEPSSGLDPIAWKTMIDVLHRYMERGDRTILMASHIVDEVRRLADYIVFMVHGRMLGMYEKDTLLESWYVLYLDTGGSDREGIELRSLPGLCGMEPAGGKVVKVTTCEARQAEEWCASQQLPITGRQKLELDDILVLLTERERLRMQA